LYNYKYQVYVRDKPSIISEENVTGALQLQTESVNQIRKQNLCVSLKVQKVDFNMRRVTLDMTEEKPTNV